MKKKIYIGIILLLITIIGVTFAFMQYNKTGAKNELLLGEIYMHYNTSRMISLDNAIPRKDKDDNVYIEFSIDGLNNYKESDIWYGIDLVYGEIPDGKLASNRIRDDLLRFTLTKQIDDNEEEIVINNQGYSSINDLRMYVETIPKDSNSETVHTYRLYVWITKEIRVGNAPQVDYTLEEWNNLFANVKVKVVGDFVEKSYINIMGTFPDGITSNKANITKVEFKHVAQDVLKQDYVIDNTNVFDLTLNDGSKHGDVRGKLENNILTIVSNGKTYLSTGAYLFRDFTSVTEIDFTNIDTSNVENMNYMFSGCSKLISLDLSNFDTHNVKYMAYMIRGCTSLTSLNISSFDTSNVTTMAYMFLNCRKISVLDLSSFSLEHANNTSHMFQHCYELTTIYVSDLWNAENVSTAEHMFFNSGKLMGGSRTLYNENNIDKTYAIIDGKNGLPGYLTSKDLHLIRETYLEQDLTTWTATNALVDSNGVATINSSSILLSPFIPVVGKSYYIIFDAYSTTNASGKTNPVAYWISYYYDSNKESTTANNGHTTDGSAVGFNLNEWSNELDWYKGKISYMASNQRFSTGIKYVQFRFSYSSTYSSPSYKIRNVKIYGEMPNSFYLIYPRMGDEREIKTIKYASGIHDLDYFRSNGIVSSEKKIRVTENGNYTVYVEDMNGHSYVETTVIDNII